MSPAPTDAPVVAPSAAAPLSTPAHADAVDVAEEAGVSPVSSLGLSVTDSSPQTLTDDQSDGEASPKEPDTVIEGVTKPGGPRLELLAAHAAAALVAPPPAASLRAQRLETLMTTAVEVGTLRHGAMAELRTLQFGREVLGLQQVTIRRCTRWQETPNIDVGDAVGMVLPHARIQAMQLLAAVEAHLAAVAEHVAVDRMPPGLLPRHGCELPLDPAAYSALHIWAAGGVCAIVVMALQVLRHMFAAYSDTAAALARQAEDPATAAKARAAKRDAFMMAGTYTNLITRAFEEMVTVLKASTVRPSRCSV